ncbi:hypothetical protein F5882DRAFT_465015 [Hyaloscypha sp. PMI_1271]|nr:hypothetical protein F5882DRAFT_465015 [Hyaloscypha sp. PMI_1271]
MPISIFLQVSCLSLAFYALGIQAVPAPAAKLTNEVSILDLLGDNPEILKVGNFSYQNSLPEPNWDDYYIEDGIKFHRYPEGTVLPAGFWDGRSKIEIPNDNATRSGLEARIAPANPCPSVCSCDVKTVYTWTTQNWNKVAGNTHQISDPLCPPGSITKSYTYSYSYSLSVQAGPDLKIPIPYLDKFGIRGGFAYTWGHATSYTVSSSDSNQRHPFIETFRPNIFVANGIAQMIKQTANGHICSTSAKSYINLHLPLIQGNNNDCQGADKSCGADGVYDSCFYLGHYATLLCPGRNLGPTPWDRSCPKYLYPSPYNV